MISFGAIIGKCSLPQLFFLMFWMMIFYGLSCAICVEVLHVADIGGSITIHMFGAYFGLASSYFFQPTRALLSKNIKISHNSETIAMVGSIFLWIFWPSFNGGPGINGP